MSCKKQVADTYTFVRAEKALAAVEDFFIDYTKTFNKVTPTDTIDTSSWAISSEGTLGVNDYSGAVTRAFVSGGGKIGNVIRLTNTVVTVGGRTHVRLIIIKIVNQLAETPVVAAATI